MEASSKLYGFLSESLKIKAGNNRESVSDDMFVFNAPREVPIHEIVDSLAAYFERRNMIVELSSKGSAFIYLYDAVFREGDECKGKGGVLGAITVMQSEQTLILCFSTISDAPEIKKG